MGKTMRGTKRELPDTSYSNSNLMNNLSQILNSATMGQPRRLRPLIGWTVAEYFFRGAPYGAMLLVVWEVFKPLQNPGTPLNLVNIGWACLMLLISLVCLWLISKKAYLVAYKDGYDICCDGRLEVVSSIVVIPATSGHTLSATITTWRCSLLTLSVSSLAGWRCPSSLWFRSHSSTGN